jgi:virginiamycin B lyase
MRLATHERIHVMGSRPTSVAGLIALLAAMLSFAAPAGAATITEFDVEPGAPAGTHAPRYIKSAPNGTLWFTDGGTKPGLGRIGTGGEAFSFIDEAKSPLDLTIAADSTVYWTAANGTGRRLPNGVMDFKTWTIDTYAIALDAAGGLRWGEGRSGSDSSSICRTEGNVWAGDRQCEELDGPPEKTRVTGIVLAPGGGLWTAWYELNLVVPTEADGFTLKVPIELPANSGPSRLAVGSDGNVWVTMFDANAIDRFLPNGTRTRFPLPAGSGPNDIAAGPDGALWYTAYKGGRIGRITTSGAVTEYPIPTPSSEPAGITTGADGNLWFTESASGKIGRLVPDPILPAADTVAPRFTAAPKFQPPRFAVAGKGKGPKGVPKGTKLKLALSEAATVTATILQPRPGRKAGKRCVAPGKAKPGAKKCTRWVSKGRLTKPLGAGSGAVAFSGKLRGKPLAPGRYRASVVARDGAGNASAAKLAPFAIAG